MEQNPFTDPKDLFPVAETQKTGELLPAEPVKPPPTFNAANKLKAQNDVLDAQEKADLVDPTAEIEAALDGAPAETVASVEANESVQTNETTETVEAEETEEEPKDEIAEHTEVTPDAGNVVLPFVDDEIPYMRDVAEAISSAQPADLSEEMPPNMPEEAFLSSLYTAAAYDA